MIIDTLKNLKRCSALSEAMLVATEFATTHPLDEMPDGRYEIDDNRVFATIARSDMRSAEDAPLETHQLYTDIQIILDGTETFGWTPAEKLSKPRTAYSAERDIQFWNDTHAVRFTLHTGEFAVFTPDDAHAPLIGSGTVRKCIIKVLDKE